MTNKHYGQKYVKVYHTKVFVISKYNISPHVAKVAMSFPFNCWEVSNTRHTTTWLEMASVMVTKVEKSQTCRNAGVGLSTRLNPKYSLQEKTVAAKTLNIVATTRYE